MNKSRFLVKSLFLSAIGVILAACAGTGSYSSIEPGSTPARSPASLELPPDLVDTSSDALTTRQTGEEASTREVLPETKTLDVERNSAEGWLEVSVSADQVWNKLVSYWGSLGVDLVESDPTTGTMQTDWVKSAKSKQSDQGLAGNVLNQLKGLFVGGPTSLDKYTLRLERRDESRTRIHVSHTGLKKIQTRASSVATSAEYEWVETEEDSEKVERMMSSIIFGLDADASS